MSSGGTSKNLLFRRASCNLVFSSLQLAISSFFYFFDNLGHSLGQIVASLVVLCTFVGRLYPPSSLLLRIWNHVAIIVQSLLGGVANACSRLPHDVDVSKEKKGRFVHWERTFLTDVLRGVDF